MSILNILLMLGLVLFIIGFLHKLGSHKEYLLRASFVLLGLITCVLLGSKLAGIFGVQPLSKEFVESCRALVPYSEAFVIFVLGIKLLKDSKFLQCSSHHHHKRTH
jgi:hypothetical protein